MKSEKKYIYIIGPISYNDARDREIQELASLVKEIYDPKYVVTPVDLKDVNIRNNNLDFRESIKEAEELQKYIVKWLEEKCFLIISYLPKPSDGRTFE
jgi:hypothetical protein